MTTSDQGRWMITRLEGVRLTAYRDVAGLLTIGVGHLLTAIERASGNVLVGDLLVPWAEGLTAGQVDALLSQDLKGPEACVGSLHLALHQRQFDALVSWVFNVGEGAARKSTLWKILDAYAYQVETTTSDELRKWVRAGGRRVQGLVNRREAEILMFTGRA